MHIENFYSSKKIVQSGDAVKVDSQESNLHSFVDLVATVIAIHN